MDAPWRPGVVGKADVPLVGGWQRTVLARRRVELDGLDGEPLGLDHHEAVRMPHGVLFGATVALAALNGGLSLEHPALSLSAIHHQGGARRPAIAGVQDRHEGVTLTPKDDQSGRQAHRGLLS